MLIRQLYENEFDGLLYPDLRYVQIGQYMHAYRLLKPIFHAAGPTLKETNPETRLAGADFERNNRILPQMLFDTKIVCKIVRDAGPPPFLGLLCRPILASLASAYKKVIGIKKLIHRLLL